MIRVFLETGKPATSEYVFVSTLMNYLNIDKSVYRIECVDGKDNLRNIAPLLRANMSEGGINLIVFDADKPETNGGFSIRNRQIKETLEDMNVNADVFLFPNNHDDGTFENLLEKIMCSGRHQQFIDCFSDYEKCLGNHYVTPNLKGKLHTYISSMKDITLRQRNRLGQGEWLFDNPDYWNLEDDYLKPLKEFLISHTI